MKTRRFIALQFASIFALMLSGCGSSKESEPVKQDSSSIIQSDVSSTSNPNTDSGQEQILPNDYFNEANFVKSDRKVENTKLVIYDGPSFLKSSDKVKIKVNGNDLFVYETRVNHQRKFSWSVSDDMTQVGMFDFEGKVHVDIEVDEESITSAAISPLIYGITPTISGKKISFDLEYQDNYVIEYNGNSSKAIQLFANPLEEDPISEQEAKNDPNILYIGPGVYKADAIPLESNQTLYLAGGAYVYGQVRMEGLENVTIRGRGIFSGKIYERRSDAEYTLPIEVRTSKNIKIEGVSFFDPAGWTITLYKSENVTIENVKIITARQNGDGISVQSCKDVTVKGGYVRTWDDSLVVKNVDRGTTKSVTFDGVNVWTDLAQSMEVGYETYGPTMDDITFKNITVIHNFHKAVISLHNSDDAEISNVTYQNITVEDGQMLGDDRNDQENDFLIDFTIAYNLDWTKSAGDRGKVKNVIIDNVKVYKMLDSIVCRMNGESDVSSIDGVTIKDVEVKGKLMTSAQDLGILANEYAKNIRFDNGSSVLGAIKTLPYSLNEGEYQSDVTIKQSINQEGVLVPTFAYSQGDLPYIGVKANVSATTTTTHSKGTKTTDPSDDGSGPFVDGTYDGSKILDGDNTTYYRSGDWKNEESEFACVSFDFDKLTTVGVIRIYGNKENLVYNTYQISVWGKRIKSDGTVNDKYTRILSSKDYEMSPTSNNYIDINITTQQYAGLQLRMYRSELVTSPKHYEIANVEFYPPALSYNAAIVESTTHNDVYDVGRLVDGNATGTSYYESSTLPAEVVIDLGDLHTITAFVMCLPPSLLWSARTQRIEILVSNSNISYSKTNTTFTSAVSAKDYLFNPSTGNINIVTLDTPVNARFVKVIISSNDNVGGYGAQLSEFSVYGE